MINSNWMMRRNSRSFPHRLTVRRQCTIAQNGEASGFSFSYVRCMLNFNSHNRFVPVRVRIISALSFASHYNRERHPTLLALCTVFSTTFHCSWVRVCVHLKWGWSVILHAITAIVVTPCPYRDCRAFPEHQKQTAMI